VAAGVALRRGFRLFAAPPGQPRARRGTDVVLLVGSLIAVAIATAAYPPSAFERSLQRLLATIPHWLGPVWGSFEDLAWLVAVALVVLALVRRRWFVLVQVAGALVIGAVTALVAARLALGSWPDLGDALLGTSRAPRFPGVRLAEATAVILTVAPHLIRPLRTLCRWVLVLGVVGTAAAGSATPSGTIASILIGVIGAAGIRLATGTSIGRPEIPDVAAGLAELGVDAGELEVAAHQAAGVFLVTGVDGEARRLLVKIYGRDAYDTRFLAKLWRSVWYRGSVARIAMTRLESAEHEAFVTLLVANGGVATLDVVTAGSTADDDALLVLRGEARALRALADAELDDDLVRAAWAALGRLEALRVAHGRIDPSTVALVGPEVGFVDFSDSSVAPDARTFSAGRVQLLMTTASLVGSRRALDGAIEALGRDQVGSLLPYLQSAALGAPLRRALKAAGIDVDDFREQAATELAVGAPELARLRRVSVRAVVQIALLGLATYAVLSAAGGVDWSELTSTLSDAAWGWVAAGFVVAQLPRIAQAVSTLGSVPAELPFGPVYVMQLATGYMNLALPSNLARMAVNVRFFQRQGISPATAVASGAIDSFASTAVQGVLLALLLIFSESSLALEAPFPSGGTRTLLWILIALVVAAVIVLLVVRRIRHGIVDNVRRWWPDVRRALDALRSSDKLALLVLGSLVAEVLFATALGLFARSFGYQISIAELLVINIGVSLLGSLVPVPGNIGVAEFGLTIGLVAAGMTDEAALAAVLLYRISTFYLPPLWGFGAMLWLQRNRYL
jgi:glycosyltransferase 2 family protein